MTAVDAPAVVVDFSTLLLDVLNFTDHEFVSIGIARAGVFRTAVMSPADAIAGVSRIPPDANVFVGINPVRGAARSNAGRGAEEDITRLACLPGDFDVKPGGCQSLDVAHAIIAELGIILGTRASVVVHTGHGLHGYWPVDDGHVVGGDVSAQRALLRRWGRMVAVVADKHHAKVDSVFDLPRMLRVPGTFNNKAI